MLKPNEGTNSNVNLAMLPSGSKILKHGHSPRLSNSSTPKQINQPTAAAKQSPLSIPDLTGMVVLLLEVKLLNVIVCWKVPYELKLPRCGTCSISGYLSATCPMTTKEVHSSNLNVDDERFYGIKKVVKGGNNKAIVMLKSKFAYRPKDKSSKAKEGKNRVSTSNGESTSKGGKRVTTSNPFDVLSKHIGREFLSHILLKKYLFKVALVVQQNTRFLEDEDYDLCEGYEDDIGELTEEQKAFCKASNINLRGQIRLYFLFSVIIVDVGNCLLQVRVLHVPSRYQ
nr:hypothetical protein [Tanacetum cinerariifolium]